MIGPLQSTPGSSLRRLLVIVVVATVSAVALALPGSALAAPPPNDNFASAQQITGDTGSVTGTTTEATFQPGEPDPLDGGSSVWYVWTAPSSGWATVHTCGSSLDTLLAVYTGSQLYALTLVGDDDQGCGDQSRVSWEAVAGTVYHISVDGFFGDEGDFTLTWNRNPPPPTPTADPTISGAPVDLFTLTGTNGGWAGVEPITYSYAWGRCDAAMNCSVVGGATAPTYTLSSADIGYALYLRVTATNAGGSTVAYSDLTARVAAHVPANTVAPIVNGTTVLGDVLLATPGAWIGTQPISFAYQWQRCDAAGQTCSDIAGQTGNALQVTEDLIGSSVRIVVTAGNAAGSTAVTSAPTAVLRRPDCVVPNVKGKALAAAKGAIRSANCAAGQMRRVFSKKVRSGRVISQSPRPGLTLANAAKVSLVISKGKKR